MANCKEDNCKNEVDTFYYCDDHFKTEEEGNMTGFEMWLKNQQQKGAYLEDAPSDGYSNEEDNE